MTGYIYRWEYQQFHIWVLNPYPPVSITPGDILPFNLSISSRNLPFITSVWCCSSDTHSKNSGLGICICHMEFATYELIFLFIYSQQSQDLFLSWSLPLQVPLPLSKYYILTLLILLCDADGPVAVKWINIFYMWCLGWFWSRIFLHLMLWLFLLVIYQATKVFLVLYSDGKTFLLLNHNLSKICV